MSSKGQQLLRQMKIIAEMKKGNYPNTQTISRIFEAAEGETGEPMGCSTRTIMRDIQDLQQEYNAPIEYDSSYKGYFLRDPAWEFRCPVFQLHIMRSHVFRNPGLHCGKVIIFVYHGYVQVDRTGLAVAAIGTLPPVGVKRSAA